LQAKSRCTGANRGLGAAIARTLLGVGAAVYRGAQDPSTITDDRIIPVRLDVTSDEDVANHLAARTRPEREDGP
jgi:NAD(P)-dependent dehydrogenase (short-subunit alcohol dehydrogenase family)